jgi:hypothetical protein
VRALLYLLEPAAGLGVFVVTPVERVRSALEAAGSRRSGHDWQCPAHEDRKASLSFTEGRDGKAVLHCHAGCPTQAVLAALGLDWPDLFPAGRKAKTEIVTTYDYVDEQGRLLYQAVRDFPKAFKRRRPDGNGGWIWKLDNTRHVLYRLPRVLAAVEAGVPVYVVEGEKDVHAIERAGATATTIIGGVSGRWLPEFSRLLAKTRTVVVADNDQPGRDRAQQIATAIAEHGGQVETVRPAISTEHADAYDHLTAGRGLHEFLPLHDQAEAVPVQDGAELLDEVYETLTRYLVFPSRSAAVATVLWVAASHAQPAWEHATRMVAKSPLKRCGKSRVLDMLEALSHNALPTANISPAALVRSIVESDPPTLLLDEADTIFGRRRGERAEATEDLRGILNAGHARGRPYVRWDVSARAVERCPTFAMVALAGIGDLPDTIEDRAVIITMRRRAPAERITPFRRRRDLPQLTELSDRLHAWIRAHLAELQAAVPIMPVEDREADVWEPLVAVADLAGGGWPERARQACQAMTAETDGEGAASERLLADLRAVFGKADALYSKTLLDRLHALEEAPWADWYGRPLTARDLAKLLRPYGVKSRSVREGGIGESLKGYAVEDLHDAWRRYVPRTSHPTHASQGTEPAGQACGGKVSDSAAAWDTSPDQRERPDVSHVADVTQEEPAGPPPLTGADNPGCLPGLDLNDPRRFTR